MWDVVWDGPWRTVDVVLDDGVNVVTGGGGPDDEGAGSEGLLWIWILGFIAVIYIYMYNKNLLK